MSNSPYLDHPTRSLEQMRDELLRQFKTMPLTDRRRAELSRRIVGIEDAIAMRRIDDGC